MSNYTYTIYNTINVETDKQIREYLWELQKSVTPIMIDSGFQLGKYKDGGLGILYSSNQDGYNGSIGLSFDDIAGNQTYSMGGIKSYDKDGCRYWVRKSILEHVELSVIEPQIKEVFQKALDIYNGWTKKDLINTQKLSSGKMLTKQEFEQLAKQEGIKAYTTEDLEKVLSAREKGIELNTQEDMEKFLNKKDDDTTPKE